MKKLLFVLAFVGFAASAAAQSTEVPVKKYSVATNSFWSNWFVTAGVDYSVFYGDQSVRTTSSSQFVKLNPFNDYRRSWGFGIGVGKWFTPGLGLRTKLNGVWGKSVKSEVCHTNKEDMKNYWTLNEEIMFNLSNMLYGYSRTRTWNFIPYVGGGVARNMTADRYAMDLVGGVMNTWRISDRVGLYFDLSYTALESKFDGNQLATSDVKNGLCLRNNDQIVTAEIGVKYNIGKCTFDNVPDVDALMAMNKEQLDALNAALRDSQNENARLKALLAQKKEVAPGQTVVKKEFATTKQSVFFNLNSAKVACRKDLVNVQEAANYAKANGNKIVVTGYADSKTGKPAYNQKLSQRRAETVKNELVKMGINESNIEVVAKGGVNDLSPYSYNRRVTVEIK